MIAAIYNQNPANFIAFNASFVLSTVNFLRSCNELRKEKNRNANLAVKFGIDTLSFLTFGTVIVGSLLAATTFAVIIPYIITVSSAIKTVVNLLSLIKISLDIYRLNKDPILRNDLELKKIYSEVRSTKLIQCINNLTLMIGVGLMLFIKVAPFVIAISSLALGIFNAFVGPLIKKNISVEKSTASSANISQEHSDARKSLYYYSEKRKEEIVSMTDPDKKREYLKFEICKKIDSLYRENENDKNLVFNQKENRSKKIIALKHLLAVVIMVTPLCQDQFYPRR